MGLLNDIINPPPTKFFTHEPAPVFQKKYYIDDLRRNCIDMGLGTEMVDIIDKRIPETDFTHTISTKEVINITNPDKLIVSLKVVDDYVNLNIDTTLMDMFRDYYDVGKVPPIDLRIKAYKSVNCSDDFIKKMINKHEKNKSISDRFGKMIEKIFEKVRDKKPSKKKPVKEKKVLIQEDEDEIIIEEEEEDIEEDENIEDEILVDEDEEVDEEPEEEIDLDDD